MVPKPRNIIFERGVQAPVAIVYKAFTNSTILREWLCDAAQIDPRPRGRIYLWWESGYYMCGEFTNLLPNKIIAFSWHGSGDPGVTEVMVTLVEKENTTQILLKQTKVKSRGGWIQFREEIQRGWDAGLENLISVLETGQDLRILRRPLLGVSMGDYGPEQATQLGVPVTEGIRLDDVIPGMGADLAGLQKNDIIVSVSGKPTTESSELVSFFRTKRAGDKIEVVFYRGSRINIATLQLSTRSLPIIPPTLGELVSVVSRDYEAVYNDLAQSFKAVSEAEASRSPSPGAWSAKEVLAHLIHSERGLQDWISDLVNNQEPVADSYSDNVQARVVATVSAYPLVADLLSELKHNQTETLNFIANLPEDFLAYKGHYWRMGITVLQAVSHIRTHLGQLQAAIETARIA